MKKFIKKRKAVTLMELIVAMSISAFVLIAAYGVYSVSINSYHKETASAELTQNARISLERMSREIRQAVTIVTALPTDPTVGAPANELKFQDGHNYWPSIGTIQYITYYRSGTDLHRKVSHYAFASTPDDWVTYSTLDSLGNPPVESTDSDDIKAQNLSLLEFWGNSTITINTAVSNGSQTYNFQTKVLGRNIQ